MVRHQWRALGQALRELRESLDLAQKQVISLSGEAMAERTLRAYESGEQRPSRDRLLRLAIRCFQVGSAAELNRLLQLASYAELTDKEVQQQGLGVAGGKTNGRRSPSSQPPADFRIEVSTLIVIDGQGQEIWRHQFPTRLEPSAYDHRNLIRRCVFADLGDDGKTETLFVHVPLDFASVGTALICFDEDGKIRWQFDPGRPIQDTRQEYFPPYFISSVNIIPVKDAGPQILVSSNHYLHNPNQIAMLDPSGALVSEYWHSGHLYSVLHADLNGDGVEEILLAGVNNGYRLGTLVILDSRSVSGASSQPGLQILGFPPGTEKAVVLFPRTCVSQNAPYNRVPDLRITRERRIVLAVVEGVSEARNPGVMIYELDFGLNVVNCRPDSHLQEAHRAMELQGVLDHSWTEDENERLRSHVIVKGGV